MNEMSKQMEMFDDGGLMDEGGTVDPVSGNNVPPGSTQEEVRDDIPAQLSEGEFVFPADVVRYFGLEKLMEMRQEAKMGLQRMEDMGQMGNSEEAIMPDNLPFDIDDIDMEDDGEPQEFNLGGVVQQPGTGIAGYTPPPSPTTGYTPPPLGVAVAPVVPGSQPQVAFTPTTAATNIPTLGQFVGTGAGAYDEMVTYVNDAGQIRQIPHINGKPIYPLPEGFKRQEKPTDVTPDTPLVDTTTTTQQPQGDGGSDRDDSVSTGTGTATVGSISDTLGNFFRGTEDATKQKSVGDIFESAANKNTYFGGSKDFGFGNEALRKATFTQAGAQAGSFGLTGIVTAMTKELGITDFNLNDVGVAGFTGMNNALNSIGLTNRGQLMNNEQATLVGAAMSAGHAAARKGQDVQAAIDSILNSQQAVSIQNKAYDSLKKAFENEQGVKGTLSNKQYAAELSRIERSAVNTYNRSFVQPDTEGLSGLEKAAAEGVYRSNVVTDRTGKPVQSRNVKTGEIEPVLTAQGKGTKDALTAKINQAKLNKEQAQRRAEYDATRDARNAQARASAQARADAAAKEAATAGPGNSQPGDYDSYGATDDEAGDVGQGDGGFSSGEDTTSAASDNYDSDGWGDFNKGGLISQMKRSGLASKK